MTQTAAKVPNPTHRYCQLCQELHPISEPCELTDLLAEVRDTMGRDEAARTYLDVMDACKRTELPAGAIPYEF